MLDLRLQQELFFFPWKTLTTNPSFGKRVPLSVTPIMEYAHSYLLSDKGGEGTQFDWTALLIRGLFL